MSIGNLPVLAHDMVLMIKAEVKRDLLYMKRYPLEIISFMFFMFLILIAIIYGIDFLLPKGSGISDKGNKEKLVLGYCLMQFVMATQMGWSGQIQNESQTGTLEQLSISGHSLGGVLFARGIAQLPRQTITFYIMLALYRIALPGSAISLNHMLAGSLDLLITAIGIFGISYIFAGITLLFKRVGFFFQIINFAFLGLFWIDRAKLPEILQNIYDHFPLTVGMSRLMQTLTDPVIASPYSMIEFIVYSFLFMAVGWFCFSRMERTARSYGLLSQY